MGQLVLGTDIRNCFDAVSSKAERRLFLCHLSADQQRAQARSLGRTLQSSLLTYLNLLIISLLQLGTSLAAFTTRKAVSRK